MLQRSREKNTLRGGVLRFSQSFRWFAGAYIGGFLIRKWNRACSRWRKQCVRRLAQKFQRARRIRRFRTCLAAALCAEVLAGAGIYWNQNRPELNLVRREEICEVELIPKTSLDGTDDVNAGRTGKANAAGEAAAAEEQDIYGVRLNLEALEVQFYHRIDSVQVK